MNENEWFKKLKSEILCFIRTASDKELEDAFEKANYEFYKNIKRKVI